MRGSVQIAKFFGIPVYIHWSFVLIFAYLFYLGYDEDWDWTSLTISVLFIVALFVCVVMHEFGHALTARRFGVQTRDIILSPIGGVARLDRLPDKPMQEFYVAIAGPLVNVAIMLALSPYLFFVPESTLHEFRSILRGYFGVNDNVFIRSMTPVDLLMFGLIMLNGTLAVFNLLPAFPMDGGRVLRALLSLRLGRALATRIATYIGQFLAILLIANGFRQGIISDHTNWMMIVIGVFVYVTAASENRMTRIDSILEKHTVADLIRVHFTKLYLQNPMQTAVNEWQRGSEKDFLVFDETENLKGILTEKTILQAIKTKSLEQPIEEFMRSDYESLVPEDELKQAFALIQWHGYNICPVYNSDQELIGVVDATMLQNFLRTQYKFRL